MIDERRELLGTEIRIALVAGGEEATTAVLRAFGECERIEKAYSRFIDGNELFDLNKRREEWVKVGSELYELLKFGCEMKEVNEGYFDMSVKSILEGWGYDKKYSLLEGDAGACGDVELGEDFCVKISAEVDLGGLGKGYALDRMVACLSGFENFCVNAGGDIFAKGRNPDGDLWKILFEHPIDLSLAIGAVEVDGMALASSSASRRKWRDKHHIVNPLKAEPANEMLAVYVQADKGIVADSYSTALFAMGYERAQKKMEDLPVEAMLIANDGKLCRSSGFRGELFM